ncbi:hypothetical protein PENSPDRAFT_67572 [Peniophora sp. CONT]|nr:hypothetical protein PENSPDRAFT_67572 [Peniophora sp. CONT]
MIWLMSSLAALVLQLDEPRCPVTAAIYAQNERPGRTLSPTSTPQLRPHTTLLSQVRTKILSAPKSALASRRCSSSRRAIVDQHYPLTFTSATGVDLIPIAG